MKKIATSQAKKVSATLSSPNILDFQTLKNQTIIQTIRNRFINNKNLKNTELVFKDFKRKQFPDFAQSQYYEMKEALEMKNKVELMRILSVPLYDLFKQNIDDQVQLPFELYRYVMDVKIVQSRIYVDEQLGGGEDFSWHQIICKFTYAVDNKDISKYNVYERRGCDLKPNQWRICHLD